VVELKGQLTVQYLASFIFFIGLIIYIYFAFSANLPAFVEEVGKEDTRSKAFQLSEILLNDPGDPADWWNDTKYPTLNDINRIGLSDENSNKNNLISILKVKELKSLCPPSGDFKNIQQKLAFNKSFSIHIFNVSQSSGQRNLIMDCVDPDLPKTSINATIRRITVLNNTDTGNLELAEIIVQM
jgi:hypothetical protein